MNISSRLQLGPISNSTSMGMSEIIDLINIKIQDSKLSRKNYYVYHTDLTNIAEDV